MSHLEIDSAANQIRAWLAEAGSQVVAFSGAGISTESGIPDFRSPGGVWANNRTVYFDEFCNNAEDRYEYWRQKSVAHADFVKASPNIVHTTLAKWEADGQLQAVVTQNIDGLHTQAGSQTVLELHGTARRVACLDCDFEDDIDPWDEEFRETDRVPECPDCQGRLKHATVSFGQSLPSDVLRRAITAAQNCKLFFALGSSLVVEPAASLPRIAAQSGAKLVIINRDATPLDEIADLVVNAPLGDAFAAIS